MDLVNGLGVPSTSPGELILLLLVRVFKPFGVIYIINTFLNKLYFNGMDINMFNLYLYILDSLKLIYL
ncbi:hypothetical protein Igag_1564 [Ignisphaera aggregans DSM 17230]|uniref:Uncharacterized protein n=1 Tax=Ignisphaera aggregans (strain DSM 17230 / JCM 13409 / AQ1.S1) TaxID=583356 RepID=E0SRB2_IGNAA|nr:hypothetical protein Igag_1564 [Ignisphaera aggregans DSM 17230]